MTGTAIAPSSHPSYNTPPYGATMYCRASFQCLLFCFLVVSLAGCDQSSQPKAREQAKESREEAAKKLEDTKNQVFTEFQKRYDADGTWQDSFKRSPVWTMDVQDRLIPANGHPILSSGSLYDVTRKGDEYRLHFRKGLVQGLLERNSRLGVVDIDFILNCSLPEDKRPEAKTLGEQFAARAIGKVHDEYAFVAKIHTIERRDRLVAKAAEDTAEIQVDDSPHFLATGECVAVKYIGEEITSPRSLHPND